MAWYKIAKIGMNNDELNKKLKDLIHSNTFFVHLFKKYNIPVDKIDHNLKFEVKDIDGGFSQANGQNIFLSPKLFENTDFFKDSIHFVIHELVHWLIRQKEKDNYFSDPEEKQAFSEAMAYEILRGKSKKEIYSTFFPIIKGNTDNEDQALKLFNIVWTRACINMKEYD